MDYKRDQLIAAIAKVDELLAMKEDLPKVVVRELHGIRKILRWHIKQSPTTKRRRRTL